VRGEADQGAGKEGIGGIETGIRGIENAVQEKERGHDGKGVR